MSEVYIEEWDENESFFGGGLGILTPLPRPEGSSGKRAVPSVPVLKKGWRSFFKREGYDDDGRPLFYISSSRSSLKGEDYWPEGFMGWVASLCKFYEIEFHEEADSNPFSDVRNYEITADFLDGGLRIYGGNYLYMAEFCEHQQGAYIVGFKALRWVLDRLGCPQPRRLQGEGLNE
ncbi:MAG: hypothetical protein RQ754_14155 [Desulfuromonadales bacterium]|nr:hypothetical protein [Desulfuromonadales bacterium]